MKARDRGASMQIISSQLICASSQPGKEFIRYQNEAGSFIASHSIGKCLTEVLARERDDVVRSDHVNAAIRIVFADLPRRCYGAHLGSARCVNEPDVQGQLADAKIASFKVRHNVAHNYTAIGEDFSVRRYFDCCAASFGKRSNMMSRIRLLGLDDENACMCL